MRLTGYCEVCHKIRTVRITRFQPGTHVQIGICSACEEEQDNRQKGHR